MKSSKQRILIAEDDANFGMMLKIFLEMNGFAATLCADGEQAEQAFRENRFDLCILDVMMPHQDGFTVAEAIANSRKDTPFVFLTAKGLKEDQIKGYQLGASDYLVKPFDPEILLLKINVLLRNTGQGAQAKSVYQIGSYAFDSERRTLSLQGAEQRLSPKEAELLKLLCERQNEVLLHEEALLKIWQNDDYFTKQSMNVFITKLRKYLAEDPAYRIEIENLHGKGFILKQEILP
jgi:two-component system, OmpR family, response regulator